MPGRNVSVGYLKLSHRIIADWKSSSLKTKLPGSISFTNWFVDEEFSSSVYQYIFPEVSQTLRLPSFAIPKIPVEPSRIGSFRFVTHTIAWLPHLWNCIYTNIFGLELSKGRVKNPSSNIPPGETRVDPLSKSIHSPCFKLSLAEQYTWEEQSKNIHKKNMEDSKRFPDNLMMDFVRF